ncbi:IS200/IS605 family transposase [uncultured Dokdonia sp.]|uniref:IS200/IS605 family transposase n=1 Tax=uncultured Dokdonia sp. TaxID=575653 RepID=UPI00260AF7B9|nr:IS200/IS605 family transposase [uncultured Dokdonia sp.]
MGNYQRKCSHTVSSLSCHIVWSTKYCYKVLKGGIQSCCRELLVETCNAQDVEILKGVVSSGHIHMHVEYAPKHSISFLVKQLKGRTSRKVQMEFSSLGKTYWGKHFWATSYEALSTGNITDEMVNEYLEHHRKTNSDTSNFILK